MPIKTKTPQPKTPSTKQLRDNFRTPRYATEFLMPFIPKKTRTVWECASGEEGMMARVLSEKYDVICTDISGAPISYNFVTGLNDGVTWEYDVVITNVPFSLKYEFIYRAIGLNKPFAFLMPFDMNGTLWSLFKDHALQAIIPNRRIDYLTPNIVERTNEYLGVNAVNKKFDVKKTFGKEFKKLDDILKQSSPQMEKVYMNNIGEYKSIFEIPERLLGKMSSSDFHSFWIVGGFDMPKDFNFIELSRDDKKRIL